MDVTGIILAGGKSRRFGRNKVIEVVGGKTILERVVARLSPITRRIILVTNGENIQLSNSSSLDFAADIFPDKGPLGGIYTGLYHSKTSDNIVVAGDMPFLNTSLLQHMVGLLPGFDAVIPQWQNSQIEPLHGIYSAACLPVMRKRLENDQLSISDCLKQLRVHYLREQDFKMLDPEALSFFNINRQSDIDRFLQIERGKNIQ
jgi:molybdopterin-guanine dinucleotide biosynthesis protein A